MNVYGQCANGLHVCRGLLHTSQGLIHAANSQGNTWGGNESLLEKRYKRGAIILLLQWLCIVVQWLKF